ncbi:uncharacterized protein BYT42DRAFT_590338 [Radiomyces spectabilis]|uniref:uncharacterized protein n=1 Tax=Radiomyces spectabilis TaxID=64574 RepID=UPI00221F3FD9|nr:uncharacterized protein BYT42DRAFT_590338 [Radiomyces spectabilis]KAI8364758.1 hypothetical protein BYT42DRAFT_590338 [Radiomyces spectabilis]
MADQESQIQFLQSNIEKNRKVRDTAIHMRSLLKDRNAISQCETEIRESQRYIDYFTEELNKLQARSLHRHSSDGESTATPRSAADSDTHDPTSSPVQPQDHQGLPPRTSSMVPKEDARKKKYSNLDLLMTATPYNKPKVSLKLHELEYKLDVEKNLLTGFKSLADLLDRDPSSSDRKRKTEVQGQLYESMEKLALLKRSLRKYKSLYIGEGDEDDYELETPPSARMPPGFRRPVTGKLQLQIIEARDLAHAPTIRMKSPDTAVFVKIDNTVVFRTRPSRTDKWFEECEIHVNKASEVEISVYDQSLEGSLPIGIFWLKITDIADGLRKRKIQQESGPGWATAEVAQQHPTTQGSQSSIHQLPSSDFPQTQGGNDASSGDIEAWFDIEPVGKMALRLNFVREAAHRRPLDKLGRAGAVRQRREEVHEMNGHQFVEKKFYNIMKCALCDSFLVNSGYQCEDCEYTCHKECYQKVVTKCISKSSSETDADEDKLNHRIPHRFVPITNIGANWCCHCGYMLPLGSRGAKKCSECDITCHTKCAHLVPDFCGLSMAMANQMLAEIKAAKRRTLETGPAPSTSTKPSRPTKHEEGMAQDTSVPSTPSSAQSAHSAHSDTLSSQLSQMSIQPSLAQTPPAMLRPQPQQPQQPSMPLPGQQPPRMQMPQGPPPLPQHGQQQYMYQRPPPPSMDPRYQPHYQPQPSGWPSGHMQQQQQQQHQPPYTQPIPNPAMMGRPPYNQPYPSMEVAPRPPPKHAVQMPSRRVGLDDFNFLAVLGKGNFGKVMLAEEKHDKNLYAIKVLKKRFIIDNDEIESVRSEKRVFQAANRERHPFLIGLHSAFQTESRVYFVMEYVSGGDLMWHIQREPFSERRAKFYACEVLLALEYFHSQNIIYRDLKLDNIMLSLDGHIKIADYGLCKENMGYGQTTGTFCGTPEFMAPEILLEHKYGRAVDWWAYGVLIYEMLLGQSPFRGEDEDEIFDAILEDEILYPINMSKDSVSICQRLLTRDPEKRLGAGPNDALDIKEHPFFRGVNWEDMLAKRVPPPFYPTITDRLDTSNFDEEFTRERPALTPIDSNLNRVEQTEFQAFSYVAEWAA